MGPEQVASSRDAVGLRWCAGYNSTEIYLNGHVTGRSRPTVPSSPLLLTTSSSSRDKNENEKEKKTNGKRSGSRVYDHAGARLCDYDRGMMIMLKNCK